MTERICCIAKCLEPAARYALCETHFGNSLPERFWSKVRIKDREECWPWMAALSAGYGWFGVQDGVSVLAHRFAYELLIGPIPSGLELDHLCRNPLCVNPWHLEPVTHQENVRRALPFIERKQQRICSVEDCDNVARSKGLCYKHAARLTRHGDVNVVKKIKTIRSYEGVICLIPNCNDQASSRGWCGKHYTRWKRHGNPLIVKR